MAAEHREDITRCLGQDSGSWSWIDRNNSAMAYPTDFGLLQLAAGALEASMAALVTMKTVKDIHPERRLTRSLLREESGAGHADVEGSLSECSLLQEGSGIDGSVAKRPGRLCTRSTIGLHDEEFREPLNGTGAQRRHLMSKNSVTAAFSAQSLWAAGYLGKGVKMGVFDTGIRDDHPHVKNIKERTNWTHEPTLEDGLGHGTFVAGVVAGSDAACPGFAVEADIYTFRVFTNDQVSFTSWFLDAFNYAIATEMDVVNLSIGGPDYLDLPFVEKVWEITSNGIIMVSAIGNDGPLYGTLNNPADQNDVLGVGGIDYQDKIATFSSRGMSTWELPRGYGRSKPDVVAYGRDVMGSRIQGGCRSLSGTSVASPVVAGAVCLLASTVPEEHRWHRKGGILNPASMKQALVEGAERIPGINLYEQGAGKMNLLNSTEILKQYKPRASVVPAELDFTDCPYMWPFCRQPLYANAMPLMFNATVLNGMGLIGTFAEEPIFTSTNEGGRFLDVRFERSLQLWPWSGFLALYIRVTQEGAEFQGIAKGEVSFVVESAPVRGEKQPRRTSVKLPITLEIIPTPPRDKRVLWDQFHSLRYPPAYIPRDSLDVRNDILDWHGDHPHTNYHDLYNAMRSGGYFLEILGSPLTCFDATQYGALLMVDLEEEYYPEEIAKLEQDVKDGLGLIVFADWYNVDTMVKMRFFDDNTRSWWTPVTGGANVPALNDLLRPYGIAFGDAVLEGQAALDGEQIYYASGANIVRFPAGGYLHAQNLADKAAAGTTRSVGRFGTAASGDTHAVLGVTEFGKGHVAVYGDSNCLDSSHMRTPCFRLLSKLLTYVATGVGDGSLIVPEALLAEPLGNEALLLPERRVDVDLAAVSTVLSQRMLCHPNAPLEFQQNTIPHRGAHKDTREAAVTKLRNDAVVVPLSQQKPLNASEAAQQGAEDGLQLSSVDPDLADVAVVVESRAADGKGGAGAGREGGKGTEVKGWEPGKNPKGMRIEDAFRESGPASMGLRGSEQDGRQTDGGFSMEGEERPARRRSFLSDTLQFMPQVLAVAGALAVLGLWTLSRRGKAKQAPLPTQDVPKEAVNMGNGLGARSRVRHSND
ncbi:g12106 [Coccomyxa viridis]|uniref:G12106 protein n=1 Tax=Coccomyxa viridis TaxID=1274662 RepID=A0ABP1G9I2_9CHLO